MTYVKYKKVMEDAALRKQVKVAKQLQNQAEEQARKAQDAAAAREVINPIFLGLPFLRFHKYWCW